MRRIDELMTRAPLVTIAPDTVIADALRTIDERNVSHLLVVENDALVGVLCACDLDKQQRRGTIVSCLVAAPVTLEPGTSAFDAARSMIERRISCIPVVKNGALVGVVTLSDLRRAGVLTRTPERCSACGSTDHVRPTCCRQDVGFCLECTRLSEPPLPDEDVGGGG